MKLDAITLTGQYVRLEPLARNHVHGLCEAIESGELWNLHFTLVPHPRDVPRFVEDALEAQQRGEELAFATIDLAEDRVVGSTRFMKINLPNKRLEIGFTFIGKRWQRSYVNTEAKLLMLTHAFEALQLNRVELLTDLINTSSRTAIARLGARQEGILRQHMIMRDGRIRDSVVFGLIAPEWPEAKRALQAKLNSWKADPGTAT